MIIKASLRELGNAFNYCNIPLHDQLNIAIFNELLE